MKTLTHICEETDKTLNHLGTPSGTLEKEAQDWIGDMEIVDYKISIKNHNLIIVCRKVDPTCSLNSKVNYLYSVIRFFPAANKWRTSADFSEKNVGELVTFMLKHYE